MFYAYTRKFLNLEDGILDNKKLSWSYLCDIYYVVDLCPGRDWKGWVINVENFRSYKPFCVKKETFNKSI